jgi:hypothetical protein
MKSSLQDDKDATKVTSKAIIEYFFIISIDLKR